MRKIVLSTILLIISFVTFGQDPIMLIDGYTNGDIKPVDTLDALVHTSNGFKLEPTIVKVDSFYNPAKDLKLPEYRIDKNIKPIVLFKNLHFKKENITGKFMNYYYIAPNSEVLFSLDNKNSTITATGDVVTRDSFKVIYNYEILVKFTENDLENEYSLIKIPSVQWTNKNFIEAPKIIWIGDLDDDNKLDFIIEESKHYATIKRGLYLSTEIKGGNYTRKVLVEDSID